MVFMNNEKGDHIAKMLLNYYYIAKTMKSLVLDALIVAGLQ